MLALAKNDRTSPGCAAVLGIPFFVGGLIMIVFGLNWWLTYYQSASWVRTPATILSLEWKIHRGSKGGTSYSVACVYRYRFGEREFTSDRLTVERGSSGGYGFQRHRYDQLVRHKGRQEPFMALVNPSNPREAILFREVGSGMCILPSMGLFLAFLGGSLAGGGIQGVNRQRRRKALLADNPGRPWRAEIQWAHFEVAASSRTELVQIWSTGLAFSVLIGGLILSFTVNSRDPAVASVVFGLLSLVAVVFLAYGGYYTLRYLKYGNPELVLAQMPLVPGGSLTALLRIKKHLITEHGVECTLKCLSKRTTGSGKSRHTTVTPLHTQTITATRDLAKSELLGSAIPVQFEIPAGQPVRDAGSNPVIEWVLEAKAATPGIDFAVKFADLPVYAVDAPSLIDHRPGK